MGRVIGPDRREFRRGAWLTGGLVVATAAIAGVVAWPLFLLSAMFAGNLVYCLLALRRRAFYLELTPTALTWQTPGGARTIPWSEIDLVWCGLSGKRESVLVRILHDPMTRADFATERTRHDLVLPHGFEHTPGDLAAILESWRNEHARE